MGRIEGDKYLTKKDWEKIEKKINSIFAKVTKRLDDIEKR